MQSYDAVTSKYNKYLSSGQKKQLKKRAQAISLQSGEERRGLQASAVQQRRQTNQMLSNYGLSSNLRTAPSSGVDEVARRMPEFQQNLQTLRAREQGQLQPFGQRMAQQTIAAQIAAAKAASRSGGGGVYLKDQNGEWVRDANGQRHNYGTEEAANAEINGWRSANRENENAGMNAAKYTVSRQGGFFAKENKAVAALQAESRNLARANAISQMAGSVTGNTGSGTLFGNVANTAESMLAGVSSSDRRTRTLEVKRIGGAAAAKVSSVMTKIFTPVQSDAQAADNRTIRVQESNKTRMNNAINFCRDAGIISANSAKAMTNAVTRGVADYSAMADYLTEKVTLNYAKGVETTAGTLVAAVNTDIKGGYSSAAGKAVLDAYAKAQETGATEDYAAVGTAYVAYVQDATDARTQTANGIIYDYMRDGMSAKEAYAAKQAFQAGDADGFAEILNNYTRTKQGRVILSSVDRWVQEGQMAEGEAELIRTMVADGKITEAVEQLTNGTSEYYTKLLGDKGREVWQGVQDSGRYAAPKDPDKLVEYWNENNEYWAAYATYEIANRTNTREAWSNFFSAYTALREAEACQSNLEVNLQLDEAVRWGMTNAERDKAWTAWKDGDYATYSSVLENTTLMGEQVGYYNAAVMDATLRDTFGIDYATYHKYDSMSDELLEASVKQLTDKGQLSDAAGGERNASDDKMLTEMQAVLRAREADKNTAVYEQYNAMTDEQLAEAEADLNAELSRIVEGDVTDERKTINITDQEAYDRVQTELLMLNAAKTKHQAAERAKEKQALVEDAKTAGGNMYAANARKGATGDVAKMNGITRDGNSWYRAKDTDGSFDKGFEFSDQVDVANRPQKTRDEWEEAGWSVPYACGMNAQVYTIDGISYVLTPMTQGGYILSPEELQSYAERMDMGYEDTEGLLLHGTEDLSDAKRYSNYINFVEQGYAGSGAERERVTGNAEKALRVNEILRMSDEEFAAQYEKGLQRGGAASMADAESAWKLYRGYMTDEQKEAFNYYCATDIEKAGEFLASLETHLNEKRTMTLQEEAKKLANGCPFNSHLVTYATKPLDAVGGLYTMYSTLTGQDVDPYSAFFSFNVFNGTVRSEHYESLQAKTEKLFGSKWCGDASVFLMQTFDSMIDSWVNAHSASALTGGASFWTEAVSLPVMGLSSAAETEREALLNGVPQEQAKKLAFCAGVFEMLFEVASLENILHGAEDPTIKAAFRLGIGGAIEGSEELFTETANIAANEIIMGRQSDWDADVAALMMKGYKQSTARALATLGQMKQVGLAGLGGLLSGFGGGVKNVAQSNAQTKATGAKITADSRTDAVMAAASVSQDPKVQALFGRVSEAYNNGLRVSNMDLGRINYALAMSDKMSAFAAIEQANRDGKVTDEDAKRAEEAIGELYEASGRGFESTLYGFNEQQLTDALGWMDEKTMQAVGGAVFETAQQTAEKRSEKLRSVESEAVQAEAEKRVGTELTGEERDAAIEKAKEEIVKERAEERRRAIVSNRDAVTGAVKSDSEVLNAPVKVTERTKEGVEIRLHDTDSLSKLSKEQRAKLNFVRAMAQAGGVNIVVHDTLATNGAIDANGTLHIALDANSVASALSHELTHYIQRTVGAESWNKFAEFLQKNADRHKARGFESIVEQKEQEYAAQMKDMSEQEARALAESEAYAAMCEDVLKDEAFVRKLIQEDANLFEKVYNWLTKTFDSFRNIIRGDRGDKSSRLVQQELADIREMWYGLWKEARNSGNSAEGGEQYMLKRTLDKETGKWTETDDDGNTRELGGTTEAKAAETATEQKTEALPVKRVETNSERRARIAEQKAQTETDNATDDGYWKALGEDMGETLFESKAAADEARFEAEEKRQQDRAKAQEDFRKAVAEKRKAIAEGRVTQEDIDFQQSRIDKQNKRVEDAKAQYDRAVANGSESDSKKAYRILQKETEIRDKMVRTLNRFNHLMENGGRLSEAVPVMEHTKLDEARKLTEEAPQKATVARHGGEEEVETTIPQAIRDIVASVKSASWLAWKDPARVMDKLAGKNRQLRDTLAKVFEHPFNESADIYGHTLQQARASYLDKMKELGILTEGATKEQKQMSREMSAAMQKYGEGIYYNDVGERQNYGLDELKAEFPNDWEKIAKAAEVTRELYDDYLDRINEMLEDIYPDVIEHAETQREKLNAYVEEAQRKANIQREYVGDLRTKLAEKQALLATKKDGTKVKAELEMSIATLTQRLENAERLAERYEEKVTLREVQRQKITDAIANGDEIRNRRLQRHADYFHHFAAENPTGFEQLRRIWSTQDAEISPELAGKTAYTQPKSQWAGFMQKRLGEKTTYDAIGGMLKYMQMAERKLAFDPFVAHLTNVNEQIRAAAAAGENLDGVESKNANQLIKWIEQWRNACAGKSNQLDRSFSDSNIFTRQVVETFKWLNARARSNAVLGNLHSSAVQISNITNAKTYIPNELDWAKAAKVLILETHGNSKLATEVRDAMERSAFMTQRYGLDFADIATDTFDDTNFAKKMALKALGIGDEMAGKYMWTAAYMQYMRGAQADTGRTYTSAIDYADDITRRSTAGRGIGEQPTAMTSNILNLMSPFQLEVNNTWQNLWEQIGKKNFTGLLNFAITTYAMNEVFKLAFGSGALPFDILGAAISAVKGGFSDDDDDEDKSFADKVWKTTKGLALNSAALVVNGAPMATLASSFAPDFFEKVLGDESPTSFGTSNLGLGSVGDAVLNVTNMAGHALGGQWSDWDHFWTEFVNNSDWMKIVLPWGGAQAQRTLKGLDAAARGYSQKMNSNGELQAQYAIDNTNPLKVAQAALFGKYSTDEGKAYLAGETKSLNAEKTEAMKEAKREGMSPTAFFEGLRGLKAAAKTAEKDEDGKTIVNGTTKQYEALMNADMTDEQKMIMLGQIGSGHREKAEKALNLYGMSVNDWIGWNVKYGNLQSGDEGTQNAQLKQMLFDDTTMKAATKSSIEELLTGKESKTDYTDKALFTLSQRSGDGYTKAVEWKDKGLAPETTLKYMDMKTAYTKDGDTSTGKKDIIRAIYADESLTDETRPMVEEMLYGKCSTDYARIRSTGLDVEGYEALKAKHGTELTDAIFSMNLSAADKAKLETSMTGKPAKRNYADSDRYAVSGMSEAQQAKAAIAEKYGIPVSVFVREAKLYAEAKAAGKGSGKNGAWKKADTRKLIDSMKLPADQAKKLYLIVTGKLK